MSDVSVSINDKVKISAVGKDDNGTIEKYVWALNGKNFKDSTTKGEIETAFKKEGKYVIKVKARDDDGLISKVDSMSITVAENPPSVTAITKLVRTPINDKVTLKAQGNDPNGKLEKYYWAMDGITFKDSTEKGEIETVFPNSGSYTVKVKARDDDGLFSIHDSIIVTVDLYAPILTARNDTMVNDLGADLLIR